jgi:CubicO group peptidase (beta-lactamase class C family)
MSSARLHDAMRTVARWVEEERIVGGTLIVIRHARLVFHESAGLRDAEADTPVDGGEILLMRSMTKPLTGIGWRWSRTRARSTPART